MFSEKRAQIAKIISQNITKFIYDPDMVQSSFQNSREFEFRTFSTVARDEFFFSSAIKCGENA